MSLRIEADEPTDQVLSKLLAVKKDNSITTIILAHQDYVLNNNNETTSIFDTLRDVVVSTYSTRRWKRLVFEYSYTVFTDKEHRTYESDNATFRKALSTLGRKLQQDLDLDQTDMGLTGDSTRADSARVGSDVVGTEHTGYGSIVFNKKNI
mmetsp:Transcript_128684/g.191760  ORF Transcript_128684/g.191760 Transcript_128684/m.191760 type:complete len:151 (+) Transcript_128684:203-655(+)|eukprot:CAMPEP_0117018632 /NCGR_PEP_ID=MMETSP0472-20121206/14385_1 /TAXON_ID=693140 ORGANISM="Tiarina fusus, Strain LIS" /NCGR_SAMPLE_ID=MMETSP0472 /ASSEMBLY_ACC=CAM_ASM_000603 /LENGTH=150 /DNA_ID=CAMNT_0004723341 /DNA_START=184 /DNA_END=636 /DNA_ORIENTATION=+